MRKTVLILLLVSVRETGSFIEVSVGILLGLWGVQSVLVPDDIAGTTVIDPLIIALYVMFALVIPFRYLHMRHSKRAKEEPYGSVADFTVVGAIKAIGDTEDTDVVERWIREERRGKNRKTVIGALEARLSELDEETS